MLGSFPLIMLLYVPIIIVRILYLFLAIRCDMVTRKRDRDKADSYHDEIMCSLIITLVEIDEPGLVDIKRIEMGTKYQSLVPKEFQDDPFYQLPSSDLIKRQNRAKKVKK